MELKDITPIIVTFVLIGVLLGIGLVILNTFQKVAATTTAGTTATTWNYQNWTKNITNLKAVTSITNLTGSQLGSGNYTVTASDGERNSVGSIKVVANETGIGGCTQNGGTNNCTINYTYYDFSTTASTSVNNTMSAISEISTNWLLIIMVVLASSFVIGIIVSNLRQDR